MVNRKNRKIMFSHEMTLEEFKKHYDILIFIDKKTGRVKGIKKS